MRSDPTTGEVFTHQLNEDGHEVLDGTPIAPPVGYRKQPSLSDQIREMIRSERLAQDLASRGVETFEDADDFEVGDDFDPSTPYENDFDPSYREIAAEVESAKAAKQKEGRAPLEPLEEDPEPEAEVPPSPSSQAKPGHRKPPSKAE